MTWLQDISREYFRECGNCSRAVANINSYYEYIGSPVRYDPIHFREMVDRAYNKKRTDAGYPPIKTHKEKRYELYQQGMLNDRAERDSIS